MRHTSHAVQAVVNEVKYKVNINTLHKIEDDLECPHERHRPHLPPHQPPLHLR